MKNREATLKNKPTVIEKDWAKEFEKMWELHTSKGSGKYEDYDKKQFKQFISNLLKQQREELIKEIRRKKTKAEILFFHKRIKLGMCRVAGCNRKLKSKIFCLKHLKKNNEYSKKSLLKRK